MGRIYIRAMVDQATHRMSLEKTVIEGDNRRANLGQWMAFIIALLFCFVGGLLVLNNHDVAGGAIATTSVMSLVAVFITGTRARTEERNEKAKLMAGQKENNEAENGNSPKLTE